MYGRDGGVVWNILVLALKIHYVLNNSHKYNNLVHRVSTWTFWGMEKVQDVENVLHPPCCINALY